MNSIFKNTVLSVCAIGLIAGCASKDVEYDEVTSRLNTNISPTQMNTNSAENSVENRVKNIAGDERSISDETNYAMQQNENGLLSITNNDAYRVTSEINDNAVLLESVHFNFDKFDLTDTMREIATSNYYKIDTTIQSYNSLKIKLEGNCDEWGTDEYNYALGLKRAKTAKDALVADGIDAKRIIMVSFGESNPVCNQKNRSCWKMNRRVDYRLLP